MMRGQVSMGAYEESQRHPGDYAAPVTQRPIAIHGLEHLTATDRAVTMFRNQVRRGIRAVRDGHPPAGLCGDEGTEIPTYSNNTLVRTPPAPDETADNKR